VVGYGPVCAKNWGLPWGAVQKAEPYAEAESPDWRPTETIPEDCY
jgi:hypothetical protein